MIIMAIDMLIGIRGRKRRRGGGSSGRMSVFVFVAMRSSDRSNKGREIGQTHLHTPTDKQNPPWKNRTEKVSVKDALLKDG